MSTSRSSWLQRITAGVGARVRGVAAAPDRADAVGGATNVVPGRALDQRWFRRQSARERARWARRALDWPLINYLETAVWFGVAVTLAVSYYGSYGNLVLVLMALGYESGPAHVVPASLDAPLTVSVVGQFLLARWKSPTLRRWRLFAVTLITAPLSLAGNALRGAVVVDAYGRGQLELALLDLHRPEVWMRLIAAMVPSIGVILAVVVTELVLREHARLEELQEATARDGGNGSTEEEPPEEGSSTGDRTTTSGRRGRQPGWARSGGRSGGRRPASEVLELVREAREQLSTELGRRPSDEEIAARMTAGGHPLAASRVRFYLPKLRTEEPTQAAEQPVGGRPGEEVVAWHSR